MPVLVPEKAPMDPVFKDGQLITFEMDEKGGIKANVQQVIDKPAYTQEQAMSVLESINNGTISKESAKQLIPSMA
jgi:hypothetical protein